VTDRVIVTIECAGNSHDVELSPAMTVGALAATLPPLVGWPEGKYAVVLYPERELAAELTLAEAGVWDGAILQFVAERRRPAEQVTRSREPTGWGWQEVR
jgi:hypothetical protein